MFERHSKYLEIVSPEGNNMTKAKSIKPKFVRRIVTAIRDNTPVSPEFIVEPVIKTEIKPLKVGGKMEAVFKVLNGKGKVNIEDAIDEFLKIQTVNAKDPRKRVRTIFLQANLYRVPIKTEKIGKEIFIELA